VANDQLIHVHCTIAAIPNANFILRHFYVHLSTFLLFIPLQQELVLVNPENSQLGAQHGNFNVISRPRPMQLYTICASGSVYCANLYTNCAVAHLHIYTNHI